MNRYNLKWADRPAVAEFYIEPGARYGNGPKLKVCVSLDRSVPSRPLVVNGIEVQDNARVWLVYRPAGHVTGWGYLDSTLWREDGIADNVTPSMRSKLTEAAVVAVEGQLDDTSVPFLWRECEIERLRRDLLQKQDQLAELQKEVETLGAKLDAEVERKPYTPWDDDAFAEGVRSSAANMRKLTEEGWR